MKKWKAYLSGHSFNFSTIYEEIEFDVSDEEYAALEETVANSKPIDQLQFYSDLVIRAEKTLEEFLKNTYEEDDREYNQGLSESEIEEIIQEDFEDIESLVYDVIIDDPNDKKRFENTLYHRQYIVWKNSEIVLKTKLKDMLKMSTSFELQTDEYGFIEYISDIEVKFDPDTISFTVDPIDPHINYSYLLKVVDNVLGKNRRFEDDFGITEYPYEVTSGYYDDLRDTDEKKSYSSYLRSVGVAIAWEYKGEDHYVERKIGLPDNVIAEICENYYDTLNETRILSGYYAIQKTIKVFERSHPDSEYLEYVRKLKKGDLILNYFEWMHEQDLNSTYDIIISGIQQELEERLLSYKVDVYLGDKYQETLQLELNTDTSTILKLIDAYNDSILIEQDKRLRDFRKIIEDISKERQQSIIEEYLLDFLNFKVETPKEIKDLAVKYPRPSYKGVLDAKEESIKKPQDKQIKKEIEKKTETATEVVPKTPSVKVEKKLEPKNKIGLKIAIGAILAVIITVGIFVYREYFVPKSPMYFDRNQLGSVVIDGNYDVFDVTYKTPEDWKFTVDDLGYWQYLKLWNQSEDVEETEDSIRVTYYDKDGKQLEEIICYNDERIRINGVLCKPDIPADQGFALPGVLKSFGRAYMQEALRPEIEKMMKKAKIDDGSIIIEMIEIPFAKGTYSRIWGLRTDAATGKDKKRILFDKTAQEYHHVAGHKLLIPLKEFLNGEKLYDMWIGVEACGVSFGYDISEIIPKELRAK